MTTINNPLTPKKIAEAVKRQVDSDMSDIIAWGSENNIKTAQAYCNVMDGWGVRFGDRNWYFYAGKVQGMADAIRGNR